MSSLAHSTDMEPGQLGTYQLLRPLSEVYFGARYLAIDDRDGMLYALTVVEAGAGDLLGRLTRAASCATKLKHPLLPRALHVEALADKLLCAAEFHEGATLRQVLDVLAERSESMPADVATRIALDALDALGGWKTFQNIGPQLPHHGPRGSWAYGALHPDTLLVGKDGVTRVIDVTLAATVAVEPRWSEAVERIAYAAPEHCGAAGPHDVQGDLFALGTLLWEMVACQPLFAGSDPHRVRESLLHGPIPRVFRARFVRGEPVSAALADLTAHALERDPRRRMASLGEASAALHKTENVASHEEVGAYLERVMTSRLVQRHHISAVFRSPQEPATGAAPTTRTRTRSARVTREVDARAKPSAPSASRSCAAPNPPRRANRSRRDKDSVPAASSSVELFVDPASVPPEPPVMRSQRVSRPAPIPQVRSQAPSAAPRRGRTRLMVLSLGALLALSAAVAAWLAVRSGPPAPPAPAATERAPEKAASRLAAEAPRAAERPSDAREDKRAHAPPLHEAARAASNDATSASGPALPVAKGNTPQTEPEARPKEGDVGDANDAPSDALENAAPPTVVKPPVVKAPARKRRPPARKPPRAKKPAPPSAYVPEDI